MINGKYNWPVRPIIIPVKHIEDKEHHDSVCWKDLDRKSKIINYFEKGILVLYNAKGEKVFYNVGPRRSIAHV